MNISAKWELRFHHSYVVVGCCLRAMPFLLSVFVENSKAIHSGISRYTVEENSKTIHSGISGYTVEATDYGNCCRRGLPRRIRAPLRAGRHHQPYCGSGYGIDD